MSGTDTSSGASQAHDPRRGRLPLRLLRVIWPFLITLALLVVLAAGCLHLLSAARAYVSGESMWSKGQKDAVLHLARYSVSCDPLDYLRYQQSIDVPLGDRAARLALQSATPDEAAARAGLLRGRNHPDDIDGMVMLFRHFGWVSFMQRAIATWTIGDTLVDQLTAAATELHASTLADCSARESRRGLLERIDRINAELTPLEQEFSDTVGDANRIVQVLLLVCMTGMATVMSVVGALLSLRVVRRGSDLEDKLFAEKERAQVTLRSIGDGVVTTDRQGRLDYLNPAAEQMTGWKLDEARGQPAETVLRLVDEASGKPLAWPDSSWLDGPAGIDQPAQATLIRRDGERVPVDESIAVIHGPDGRGVGLAIVLRNVADERQRAALLSYQASHDGLTGLANRRAFEAQLGELLAAGQGRHCVLYLDLDQFKVVNDACGHASGDALLCRLAELMRQSLRESDTLARMGGDEFCVILRNCLPEAAQQVAEQLRHAIAGFAFVAQERKFRVGVSIGLVETLAGLPADELLALADAACCMAKEKGRNRVEVYRGPASAVALRRSETGWFSRIQEALADNRFVLHAQEIVAVREPQATGKHLEVLVRMLDEQQRLVPPLSFIPAAERFGLMGAIDQWVITKAFAAIAQARAEGRAHALRTCAINVSGASIADEAFPAFLHAQFACHGVPHTMVCFEITETAVVSNLPRAAAVVAQFRKLGCRFALDDFGSGMSSFAYLKQLPVDYVKIDGNFVRQLASSPVDRAMVKAIQQMAQALGMQTIAEYVEDPAVLALLADLHVDFAQGYGIARPRAFLVHGEPDRPATASAAAQSA